MCFKQYCIQKYAYQKKCLPKNILFKEKKKKKMLISNRQDSIKTTVGCIESQITKSFISKFPHVLNGPNWNGDLFGEKKNNQRNTISVQKLIT